MKKITSILVVLREIDIDSVSAVAFIGDDVRFLGHGFRFDIVILTKEESRLWLLDPSIPQGDIKITCTDYTDFYTWIKGFYFLVSLACLKECFSSLESILLS